MRSFILKGLCILQLTTFSQAKEISIKETVEFLQSKLDVQHTRYYRNNKNGRSFNVIQSFINNDNCNFTLRVENEGMKKLNELEEYVYGHLKKEYIFNAKDLNPEKIVYNDYVGQIILMETRESKDTVLAKYYSYEPFKKDSCIKEKGKNIEFINSKECVITNYTSAVYIGLLLSPHDDNGPRVMKAMKHLVQMCGGKDELF